MDIIQEFHFLRPYWLLALFLLVPLYIWAIKQGEVLSSWARVCDKNLLEFLLVKNSGEQKNISMWRIFVIVSTLVIALAGPSWSKKDNPALSVNNPVMILLNMSQEMWSKDVSPSRIVRAKYLIKDITAELNNTESGLIVYSSEPYMITPLTEDDSLIDNLLPALELNIMPENGDRLDRAVDLAVQRMKEAYFTAGNIIVLTSNVGERFDAALSAVAKASEEGFDVNIIKVASDNSDKLQMVADKGKGMFLTYNQSIKPLVDKINDITAKEIKQSENMQTTWEDMGYYVLWLPALLLLRYFRRGALAGGLLFLMMSNASAGWFLNDNQEAMRLFEAKNYQQATEKFTQPQWKASSAYRAGDFQTAYDNFAKSDTPTALYNQGNALAKGGKIDDAIKKYEEVLQQVPDFEDARFNLEYLKKQQQNQQQNQNDKQDNKDNQQQQNQKQQSAQNKQNQQEQQQQNQQQNQEQKQENSAENQQQQNQQEQQNQQSEQESEQNQSNQNAEQNQAENAENQSEQNDEAADDENEDSSPDARPEMKENDGKEQESTGAQVGDKNSPEEQEKMRARMQKFREIPEDKGGLLRAFIKKEFEKNRYKQ